MSFAKYPAYKDSGVAWLGEVPGHWEITPLYAVATERDESNAGMLQDNLLSLSYGKIVNKDINSNDGLLPESFETYQIVRCDDIVFRLTDLQNDKRSLRSALVKQDGIITSAYLAIQPNDANAYYLSYLFRSYDTTKVFYSMGGGLRQSMKFSDMKRLPTLLPPPEEQTAIATFLDHETARIDALVAEQERLIALLQEKRQAVISHAVTKGLNPHAPMKDSGVEWLGEVPGHWEVRRIRDLSSFLTSGPRGWSERISEEGAKFIQSGDLTDELSIAFDEAKRVAVNDDAEAARTKLADGDVVVCITGAKTGNVALCGVVPEDAYVNQHLCLIRPRPDILPDLLAIYLKSDAGQRHFAVAQYGLKQGMSLENIKETPVLVPPIHEQRQIVEIARSTSVSIGALITAARTAITLLQERRTALVSAAVTGQIDVRGWAKAA